ncbi:LRR receptor serine/threonine-protein kinase GSO1 [Spatholobus suberectus]|nr:LRR receptor serine/threonine-protein kinase GSO1 [Spatholobus suberectus]
MFRSLISGSYSELDMSNNSIGEDISNVMLNSYTIQLGYNNFTGRLPHLSPKVLFVDLSHNSFTGLIPHGWENLKHLIYINLWGNKLFGEVLVFSNLTQLEGMNIGKNEFSGTIPINMSQNLEVVILRSNQFEGSIPPQMFNLKFLIHLDLARNKLSGSIPQIVYNTTQMITDNYSELFIIADDIIDLFTKGQVYEYKLDFQRRTIDLSANNLSGEIPSELFGLSQVQTLNLSYNHLTGTIPKTIGGMKNLESLDLSNNKFSGEIPQDMSTLSFLGFLNLSCNNFTGQIPIGTQLQSFNASSYIGNPELCGAPLSKCRTEENNPVNAMQHAGSEDGDSEKESFYLGMGVGFAVGFWGICGSLLLVKEWRHKYYRFLDRVSNQLYVTYMMKFNSFLNRKAPTS